MLNEENYIIRISECFKEEYYDIVEYMLCNLYFSIYLKFKIGVSKTIENLRLFPRMYAEYPKNRKYRRCFVKNYVIFYKIENKTVDIVHIYYNRKNSFNLNF